MSKLAKVIISLERCTSHVPDPCQDCAYDYKPAPDCWLALERDALELLKKQEQPQPAIIEDFDVAQIGRCPSCNVVLQPWGANYCHKCGQAVKWHE